MDPLRFVFYIAGPPDKVWDAFVSPESNRIIYMGAEFECDLKPGGYLKYSGPGPDGKPTVYVSCGILEIEASVRLQYTFAMGKPEASSRVTLELKAETEATKVTVVHDEWAPGEEKTYGACADGWPRILSRLKTLIETGKTFKPH